MGCPAVRRFGSGSLSKVADYRRFAGVAGKGREYYDVGSAILHAAPGEEAEVSGRSIAVEQRAFE